MSQEEIEELKVLQLLEYGARRMTIAEQSRLYELRVKLSRTEAEVADDPNTLRDETRSPKLSDDKDYHQEQVKRDVVETVKDVKEAVGFIAWLLGLLRSYRG